MIFLAHGQPAIYGVGGCCLGLPVSVIAFIIVVILLAKGTQSSCRWALLVGFLSLFVTLLSLAAVDYYGPHSLRDDPVIAIYYLPSLIICCFVILGAWKSRPRDSADWWPNCSKCGYNLTGLMEPRCPECGTPFDRRFLKSRSQTSVFD
jgi:predicted RNA-binding Zn-ribbon protein involved in translation (DUF1610 family)